MRLAIPSGILWTALGNTLAKSKTASKQFVRNIWVQKLVGFENGAGGSKNHHSVLYKTRQTEAYLDIM